MTSTFLGYKIYANDLAKTLQHVAAEPSNASDEKYYEANIGKVKSADDFVNNFRLLNHAMAAYGLSSLGNAKAFMKKVLESDLTNSHSFANSLNDSRYVAFARAFNFTTKGTIASSSQAQTASQQNDLVTRMNLTGSAPVAMRATLSALTSVSSLESNTGLYAEVLNAYGFNTKTTPQSSVTLALESNLSDPNSFANRPANAAYRALAEDFNFGSDGNVTSQHMLQSPQDIANTQVAYNSQVPATPAPSTGVQSAADKAAAAKIAAAQSAASEESAYYAKKMPEVTSVDQIVGDPRLVAYITKAFGLPSTTSATDLRGVLTSNLLDPTSKANTLGIDPKNPPTSATAYQTVASAFNIGTDGTAWDHQLTIPAAKLTTATTAYTAAIAATASSQDTKTSKATIAAGQTETDYFNATAPTIRSVGGLLADSRLVAYLRTAFNLPAPTTSAPTTSGTTTSGTTTSTSGTTTATPNADLQNILTSDLLDPKSVANTSGAAARALATAFNFTTSGLVYNERPIQNATNIAATTAAYTAQEGTSTGAKAAAATETAYYTSTITRVKSVDDLLSNKRLVTYLNQAYGLPTTTNTTTLRQVLTSNLNDLKSKANTLGGGYQTLAAAFDISTDGTITHVADQQAQGKTGIAATHSAYLEQALETEAGQSNDGVRLALYFRRAAPTITSAYDILADKALTAFVQTALGLPATSSSSDIDAQARTITSKIKLSDLKNPAKVERLIATFSALYDVTNASSSSSSSTVSQLFGSSS